MRVLSPNIGYEAKRKNIGKILSAKMQPILHFSVALWVFSGSFVMIEPSPYEFLFFIVLPIAVIARVGLHVKNFGLFVLFCLLIPFGFIAAFQVVNADLIDALIYAFVTYYLFFTAYFVANYVADAPFENMRNIMRAWMLSAIIAALIGTLAYLSIIPGEELFTRYGRAKAAFKDPNVYGPFLVLPAMYALQRILLCKFRKSIWPIIYLTILFIGVFVSFSRGAWGLLLLASIIVFSLNFALEADARQKLKMIALAIAGVIGAVVILLGLLSIPSVKELFTIRAQVVQDYDGGGEMGRFGRQKYAFELALEKPLGIGAGEFARLRIKEEPHNTYVNIFHIYGWGGGLVFIILIWLTIKKGVKSVMKKSPNRSIMIPLIATFIPLMIEAAIIDIDHWRLFYILVGLIWGVAASYDKISPEQSGKKTIYI